MGVASYQTLKRLAPIANMVERTVVNGMSYGLSHAGYDIRIDQDVQLAPGQFILASSVELFVMPNSLIGVVHDKSTWARLGLTVQNTVIEPSWTGYLTLELTNHSSVTISIQKESPIAQVLFHILDEPTEKVYQGKYQNQSRGPQEALYEH